MKQPPLRLSPVQRKCPMRFERCSPFPNMGTLGPRSYRSTSRLVSELRQAVYNASSSQTLTANHNAVDQEIAALGLAIA